MRHVIVHFGPNCGGILPFLGLPDWPFPGLFATFGLIPIALKLTDFSIVTMLWEKKESILMGLDGTHPYMSHIHSINDILLMTFY